MDKQRPVIVIGMHRSGTSIIAKMLSELGVHMGHMQDVNHEPIPYVSLNNWILRQAGTTWEYPLGIARILDTPEAMEATSKTIERATHRTAIRSVHLGAKFDRTKTRWGWKDPRNTATLPIWMSAYPDAQVIYVHRHGIPVAASLVERHSRIDQSRLRARHRLLAPVKPGLSMGSRAWNMNDAIEMWSEYYALGRFHVSNLGVQAMSTSYEELLVDPLETAKQISQFLDIAPSEDQLATSAGRVRSGNPMKFREEPELRKLEEIHGRVLAEHGYGPS